MSPMPSPSTLMDKRCARIASPRRANQENVDLSGGVAMSRSGSDSSFRLAGKFPSNSSLSIAIHPPSKADTVAFRKAAGNVELPPTPITAGLDAFPGSSSKSSSPALLNIELPLTPTSAGFPSSPATSSLQAVELPALIDAQEFEDRLRQLAVAPGAPKIGACESGIFTDFSAETLPLSEILPAFPPALSDCDESMLDILYDDVDEEDDKHEAQTPMKHIVGMSRGSFTSSFSMGAPMEREATVKLISTPEQLEMQSAFQRRRDGGDALAFGVPPAYNNEGANVGDDLSSTGPALSSQFGQLDLKDSLVPIAVDNGLGLTLGPISGPSPLGLPNQMTPIIVTAQEGLLITKGLTGLGISLQGEPTKEELSRPTLAPPGQIQVTNSRLRKRGSDDTISERPYAWQENASEAMLPSQASSMPPRMPLSESRRSSNATATPRAIVGVNRSRFGVTPTNSPTTKVGTPVHTSPTKRLATAAALSSVIDKENYHPGHLTGRRSSKSSGLR